MQFPDEALDAVHSANAGPRSALYAVLDLGASPDRLLVYPPKPKDNDMLNLGSGLLGSLGFGSLGGGGGSSKPAPPPCQEMPVIVNRVADWGPPSHLWTSKSIYFVVCFDLGVLRQLHIHIRKTHRFNPFHSNAVDFKKMSKTF